MIVMVAIMIVGKRCEVSYAPVKEAFFCTTHLFTCACVCVCVCVCACYECGCKKGEGGRVIWDDDDVYGVIALRMG